MARNVPQATQTMTVAIVVNGQQLGEVDPDELTIGAQMDLEDAKSTRQVIQWMGTYANADVARVEEILRPLKARELHQLVASLNTALQRAVEVPK